MRESNLENLTDYDERMIGFEFENPIVRQNGEPINFDLLQEVWRDFEMALPPMQNLGDAENLYILVRGEILSVLSKHYLSIAAVGIYPGSISDVSTMRDHTYVMTSHEVM